jgi:hypothetical protein
VTLPAHKVTDFVSLTSGVRWNPSLCGPHVVLLVSNTKSVTLWAGKVTEAQSEMGRATARIRGRGKDIRDVHLASITKIPISWIFVITWRDNIKSRQMINLLILVINKNVSSL